MDRDTKVVVSIADIAHMMCASAVSQYESSDIAKVAEMINQSWESFIPAAESSVKSLVELGAIEILETPDGVTIQ